MAIRLGAALGNTSGVCLNTQHAVELYGVCNKAYEQEAKNVRQIVPAAQST